MTTHPRIGTNTAVMEFLGTFILVSTICFIATGQGNVGAGPTIATACVGGDCTTGRATAYAKGAEIALGGATFLYMIPMGLFIAVTLGANVSGACFNPAVTFACELRKSGEPGDQADWAGMLTKFWLPQCLGALVARYVSSLLLRDNALDGVFLQPQLIFDDWYSMVQVMLIEMWGTFLFTMVILNCTGAKSSNCGKNSGFAHFTLCLALVVAIYICAPISGAGMNPAVAVGLNVMAGLFGSGSDPSVSAATAALQATRGKKTAFGALWAYLVGPLLGAAMSGLIQKHMMDKWHVEAGFEALKDELVDDVTDAYNTGKDKVQDFSNEMGRMGDNVGHKVDQKFDHMMNKGNDLSKPFIGSEHKTKKSSHY